MSDHEHVTPEQEHTAHESGSEHNHDESFAPHEPTETDAGNGRGTVSGPPAGDTQDRPIMDGSTLSDEEERQVDNPRRGMEDPALIRDVDDEKKTANPYG